MEMEKGGLFLEEEAQVSCEQAEVQENDLEISEGRRKSPADIWATSIQASANPKALCQAKSPLPPPLRYTNTAVEMFVLSG